MNQRNFGALLATMGLFLPVAANAQSYTESTSSGSFSSIDLTGSAVSLSSMDDGYGTIVVPFAFDYFGTPVTTSQTLYVNTNGTLHIDTSYTDYSNVSFPDPGTPNGFMAPFWDDLKFNSGGIYYETTGVSGSRTLTIEWSGVSHYSHSTETFSFQVQIHEGSGVIEYHYGPHNAVGSSWSGSVGLENSTGTAGAQNACTPSCTPSALGDGTILVYTPNNNPPAQADLQVSYISTPPSSVQEGSTTLIDFEVYNAGLGSSAASSISLFIGSSPTVTTADLEVANESIAAVSSGSYAYGTFSASVPVGFSGTYYLAAIVDPYDYVVESDETNNTYAIGSITITGSGGAITVTTTSLPSGQLGAGYSAQLAQSGATSPYWSVISGQLPPGLSLSGTGQISGAPTTEGLYEFRVQAEEEGLTPGTADLSIDVGAAGGVQITTTELPSAEVGVPYQASIQAVGGVPPYAFQIISGRPEWLLLDSEGTFSGTPDTEGTHELTVSVFDSNFADATTTLTLSVTQPQALSIATELPGAVTGREYGQQVISGGVPPYQVQITQDPLPEGLSIDGSGLLSGVPTVPGTFTFEVSVTDSNTPPATAQGRLQLEILELTDLHVAIGRELILYVSTDVDQPLEAQGGVPPYTWGIVQGALQPGLSLDAAGARIVGRVDQVGTATVTFMVTDSEGTTAEAEVLVRATVYRSSGGGSGRGGGGRRGGCVCVGSRPRSAGFTSALLLLALAGLLLRRRHPASAHVQRRRVPPRPAAPH